MRDEDLDYVPSARIGNTSRDREPGTLPELSSFKTEPFSRCVRLRFVRGLGPSKLASVLSKPDIDDVIDQSIRMGFLTGTEFLNCLG